MTTRNRKLPDVPTFIEQGVDSKIFALTGYIFLAGPIDMPREIVERLSGLMVEAGKTDRVQKLLDSLWHRRVRSRAHRVQETVRQRNASFGWMP